MPWLAAGKRHRGVSTHRDAALAPGVTIEPRWHVDGNNCHTIPAGVDHADCLGHDAINVARQSRAENRIDDDDRSFEHARLKLDEWTIPTLRHLQSITFQGGAITQKGHGHVTATLFQMPGDDEAIASVIARPTQHDDVISGLE